ILTSPDGDNWVQRQPGTKSSLWSIAVGNGLFVAVGGGTILTSTDGDKWVRRTNVEALNAIAYGKGLFVAVGDLLDVFPILTSADGVNWFSGIKTGYRGLGAQAIAYGAGYFVAVGRAGIWTSADGLNWVQRPTGSWLWGIAYGNGHFVEVGGGGSIVQS